jgi:hypothetical protein
MITVTFTTHPIETAPKDRRIALLEYEQWGVGAWSLHDGGYWCSTRGVSRRMQPTHWAEIDHMKPAEPTGSDSPENLKPDRECLFDKDEGFCQFFCPGANGCRHCGAENIRHRDDLYKSDKEADRKAELKGNRPKYQNPTNVTLSDNGLTKKRL